MSGIVSPVPLRVEYGFIQWTLSHQGYPVTLTLFVGRSRSEIYVHGVGWFMAQNIIVGEMPSEVSQRIDVLLRGHATDLKDSH